MPTGSRLVPPSRSARAAPASTTTLPRTGLAYFSHSLKLEYRPEEAANVAPTWRPAAAERIVCGPRPLQITVGIPAAVAISAATTFERIPPEPSGELA